MWVLDIIDTIMADSKYRLLNWRRNVYYVLRHSIITYRNIILVQHVAGERMRRPQRQKWLIDAHAAETFHWYDAYRITMNLH